MCEENDANRNFTNQRGRHALDLALYAITAPLVPVSCPQERQNAIARTLDTDDNLPHSYRCGHGVPSTHLNLTTDFDRQKARFEIGGCGANSVFFRHPR